MKFSISFILFLYTTTSYAQTMTGLDIMNNCQYAAQATEGNRQIDKGHEAAAMYCMGLLQGITEMNNAYYFVYKKYKNPHKSLFCLPSNSTYGQQLLVFMKYLKEHPQDLHNSGTDLMIAAMINGFPCTNND